MFLDDIVRFCLPLIFNGRPYDHFEAYTFKFTKDAEMELDSDLRNSIMQKISKGVKSRKNGEPIRLSQTWKSILFYAVCIVAVTESIYLLTKWMMGADGAIQRTATHWKP